MLHNGYPNVVFCGERTERLREMRWNCFSLRRVPPAYWAVSNIVVCDDIALLIEQPTYAVIRYAGRTPSVAQVRSRPWIAVLRLSLVRASSR